MGALYMARSIKNDRPTSGGPFAVPGRTAYVAVGLRPALRVRCATAEPPGVRPVHREPWDGPLEASHGSPAPKWVDPRDLIPPKGRDHLMGHAGLSALFEALAETGPARVPVRWRAAGLAGLSGSHIQRHFPPEAGRASR